VSKSDDVGPLAVAPWLEKLRAGKLAPLTNTVQVSLHPAVVKRSDEIHAQIEAWQNRPRRDEVSITEAPPDVQVLEDELNALIDEHSDDLVTLTFRGRWPGDEDAIRALNLPTTEERIYAITAQRSVDPVLTVDDVKELLKVIGGGQFVRVTDCWSESDAPTAPKSLTRSPSPATGKR
jgi:hypothetical protein